ncbi:MAG TPA: hypothetical protein VFX30_13225 [bacterium]|nr:hypothetical protein [bacterium]
MFCVLNGVPFVFAQLQDESLLGELYRYCLSLEKKILALDQTWKGDTRNPTTSRYGSYNFLKFDHPCVGKVFDFIRANCREMLKHMASPKRKLWIQCWINIHRKGQALHKHHHSGYVMHGHMTVHTRDTSTVYGEGDEIVIENRPGMMTVIGKNEVPHYVTPYRGPRGARVSIAFDVISQSVAGKIRKTNGRVIVPFD